MKKLIFYVIVLLATSFAQAQNVTITPNGIAPITSTTSYSVGQSYGGGTVFYVYDNGQHGLIAAMSDVVIPANNESAPYVRWSIRSGSDIANPFVGNYTPIYAKADGVGAGLINMLLINAIVPFPSRDFAASACVKYSVTMGGTKYGDWYLPSIYELNLMYLNHAVISNFGSAYWSSTEGDISGVALGAGYYNAWAEDVITGEQFQLDKFTALRVRAIRRF